MEGYSICNNYLEIIAGTNNTIQPAYMEAAQNIEKDTPTGMGYLKNFITSIESIASKDGVKDERITKSRGNIKNFSGYDNIKSAISFLNKNLKDVDSVKDCVTVFDALENYQPLFINGYDKNVRLIILEYESAVYLLVTALSMIMANNIDVVSNGSEIRIQKKSATTFGIIPKTLRDLAKQLGNRNHKDYLEAMIKAVDDVPPLSIKESTSFMESSITDTLELINSIWANVKKIGGGTVKLFKTIKSSLFGIVPLIRSIIYLRYKKKADTILSLEQQVVFIQRNIEQLQNIKTMDPAKKAEIIKKQQAVCEQYKKKAEKLRAELCEGEKAAATEIKKEDPKMKNTDDDDFVLESGSSVIDIFSESKKKSFIPEELVQQRKSTFAKPGQSKKSFMKAEDFPPEKRKKMDAIIKEMLSSTEKDTVTFTLKSQEMQDDPKGRMKSKLGGIPYWPKSEEWPTKNGKPMALFAQINFADMPNIPGYPTSGILQVFTISINDWYGSKNNDDPKIIFFDKPDVKIEQLEEIPRCSCDSDIGDALPFKGVFYVEKFMKEKMSIQWGDNDFYDILKKALSKYPDITENELEDYMITAYPTVWGHRIGGWDNHTQNDPKTDKYNTLLLQIDSERKGSSWQNSIIWGDNGIANLFINDQALKRKDFSDVLAYWDCY